MCGENIGHRVGGAKKVGSPPRVRGKRCKGFRACCLIRITPACAGKTLTFSKNLLKVEDHPRVCGENLVILIPRHCEIGSPPRVRGKRELLVFTLFGVRITPACAGKTC